MARKYISQYRQKYVPYSKYIVKSGIDSVSVLDLSSNTVLLSFWVIPQNLNSDYFLRGKVFRMTEE